MIETGPPAEAIGAKETARPRPSRQEETKETDSAATIHHTAPPRHLCVSCRIVFEPSRPHHRLCSKCIAYALAGAHVRIAHRALRRVAR
jgi:hypothetical protein